MTPNHETKYRNRLAEEKSPYLLQHADNPVDWYPWSDEAFAKAAQEDKPVFLSIGYSTCHWCHVMAHESFEDEQVAGMMNDTFVSVKVDREERPDIDGIYMTVCQMMTGAGGWPLTIIMTPDKKPFFAATYIPRESRMGLTGLMELIPLIRETWEGRKARVLESADSIASSIQKFALGESGAYLNERLLERTFENLAARFDSTHGGFGEAPKFPMAHNLLFLLRYWKKSHDEKALEVVEQTLKAMRRGGIYDHVGLGFHRYSTDRQWLVPHFEKMLYDQAMLLMAYTEAYQATGGCEYEQTAREIISYVLRDMHDPKGAFYSAEDADSEGVEGKFYLWQADEIRQILGDEADSVIAAFNVSSEGNYYEANTWQRTGHNILHLTEPLSEGGGTTWENARQKLFAHREKRVHPHRDDKVLTDWNGLMIAALAKAAQAFDEPAYADAAKDAADFILNKMRSPEGRLLHRYRDGEAALSGFAVDYAFLIWGLLELYEATFEVGYLEAALDLNRNLIDHFWDEASGAFFTTPDDGEELFIRQKEIHDGALPSANSVAMLNLLRLGRMTANPELEQKAAQIGRAFSVDVEKVPAAYTQLMCALSFAVGPGSEVVIAGDPDSSDTKTMLTELRSHFAPNKVVLFNPTDEKSPKIHELSQFTKDQVSIDGKATAYVCKDYNCQLPTADPARMLEILDSL
ncbi:MAG: thioredoxin domain-containing protein [Dehalococcoidia bacterium]